MRWMGLGVAVLLGGACRLGPPPIAESAGPARAAARSEAQARSPSDDLAALKVYDTAGAELACDEPRLDCGPEERQLAFERACEGSGFRVQRCGCGSYCTGRVEAVFYDAEGRALPCPRPADCAPPAASAAFQDACTDRGHRLEACSCEAWLCSGDPTR